MRVEAALVLVLVTGGWVCDGDNPCPGANTCEIDVAKVCCPFGQRTYCNNACSANAQACADVDTIYACRDEEPPPVCEFAATVDAMTCTSVEAQGGLDWRVQISGTATGCGDEGIYFAHNGGLAFGGVDCGDWAPGMFRTSCIPRSSSTTWSADDVIVATSGTLVTVDVATGDGQVLATLSASCF